MAVGAAQFDPSVVGSLADIEQVDQRQILAPLVRHQSELKRHGCQGGLSKRVGAPHRRHGSERPGHRSSHHFPPGGSTEGFGRVEFEHAMGSVAKKRTAESGRFASEPRSRKR